MFNSVFAKEMTAFLELRRSNVSVQTFAHDTVTLAKLDCHLAEQDYREKDLSEEILLTWIRTLSGKSKTVQLKVLSVRNFVRYLNGSGSRISESHCNKLTVRIVNLKACSGIRNGFSRFRIHLDYLDKTFKVGVVDEITVGCTILRDEYIEVRH